MSIKILPPQLANQIAAGEVVERPASVVKELVENALDAGASQIDIEIDKGGHKRILIRDNGKGINKDELALALSRHATSKITNIDDLEAIVSLGFRGEALASVSSVSRLTITSKPKQQEAAWSAIAEGLDMAVKVLPAAHPNGTSVEVLDLFFNTPARRKFLRAEKTEFNHIETLIKRIALSRADVTFVLKHNGKVVKRFRSQAAIDSATEQKSNRIAEVVNPAFVESCNVVTSQYDNVDISVWIKSPEACVSVNPAQYTFVNDRMMRDKLIQHAIRQAYGDLLGKEQLPEYVVFINLPAEDVDVNVHPAKHEVRFHYARLLHDFLVKTIEEALAGFYQQTSIASDEPEWLVKSNTAPQQSYQQAARETEIEKSSLRPVTAPAATFPGLKPRHTQQNELSTGAMNVPNTSGSSTPIPPTKNVIEQELKTSFNEQKNSFHNHTNNAFDDLSNANNSEITEDEANICFIEQNQYVYFVWQQQLWLITAEKLGAPQRFSLDAAHLVSSPLLVPVRLKLTAQEKLWCATHQTLLHQVGFEVLLHQDFLIIKQVPIVLRNSGTGHTLPGLMSDIMTIECSSVDDIKQHIVSAKAETRSPDKLQSRLNTIVAENALNLKKVAVKINPALLLAKSSH